MIIDPPVCNVHPACNPHTFLCPDVSEESFQRTGPSRAAADARMYSHVHHLRILPSFFVQYVERILQIRIEIIRVAESIGKVVKVVDVWSVGD